MRDTDICHEYQEGNRAERIAAKYGLSKRRVYQILDELDIKRRHTRHSTKLDPPLSEKHRILGLKIYNARFDKFRSLKEESSKLNWSIVKLSKAEKGQIDFTLTDLQKIAKRLDLTVKELL